MEQPTEQVKQFVYVEPMGHGAHFVAEVAQASIIPGTVQLHVLRGDGSIDRTIGMNGSSIFRWTFVSAENAVLIAQQLEQRQSMYDVSIPQRLLLEAAKSNALPEEKEYPGGILFNVHSPDDDGENDDDYDEDGEDE
jgi:hypothetical protein